MKKSDTSGIESATFRLLAQCLNQLRYRVPQSHVDWPKIEPVPSVFRDWRLTDRAMAGLVCTQNDVHVRFTDDTPNAV
jgi:hypothetical protein